MSDHFLSIPDQMIGATLFPQEAVDWLAFGSPEQGARSSLSLDDQIRSAHSAAGVLLMAIWRGDLSAYVRSPSLGTWYQVPALYWGRQTSESMRSAMQRPDIPDRLPGQPRPLDPRYGIEMATYPHRLPATDLVGQVVAFRAAEVERYCVIAKPLCEWKLNKVPLINLDGCASERTDRQADRTSRPPLGTARLREWIVEMNRGGKSQSDIARGAASAFPDFQVPGRPTIRQIDADVRVELRLPHRRIGKPRQ